MSDAARRTDIRRVIGPDYILDLSGAAAKPTNKTAPSDQCTPAPTDADADASAGRPWLAIHWRCCETYSRVYRNREGTAYHGRCPRCGKALRVPVGPGGTNSRFFEAF